MKKIEQAILVNTIHLGWLFDRTKSSNIHQFLLKFFSFCLKCIPKSPFTHESISVDSESVSNEFK